MPPRKKVRSTRPKVRSKTKPKVRGTANRNRTSNIRKSSVQAKSKAKYKQGLFTPRNPEKYLGNVDNIEYRSSWERDFNIFLDNNERVLRWASEEIAIPYYKPTSKRADKIHKYYPDYYVEYVDRHGELHKEVIEVKPLAQTKAPTRVGKNKKTQLYEQINWAVNQSKWKAAQQFCDKYGFRFRILTEKQLFL